MHRRSLAPLLAFGASALVALLRVSSAGAAPAVTPRMFVDEVVPIPASLMTSLGSLLPDGVPAGSAFSNDNHDPGLLAKKSISVKVTFLRESTSQPSALGYFTYTSEGGGDEISIKTRQLVFPWVKDSAAGGQLNRGDTVTLRDKNGAVAVFPKDTRIGFFLVSKGWTGAAVTGWNPASPVLPALNPGTNAATASGVFSTLDALNPEVSSGRADVSRHYVSLRLDGISGFLGGGDIHLFGLEDVRRNAGSDNDFNDVLFLVQGSPASELSLEHEIHASSVNHDPDGDGVKDLADAYPDDGQRASTLRSPPTGYQGLSFEDTYPFVGDMDYNDAFFEYAYDEVLRADGRIKELMGTYHLIARGAGFDHRFGVALHGVPASVSGTLVTQCFSSAGERVDVPPRSLHDLLEADADGAPALRIPLFEHTKEALPDSNTASVTPTAAPASCRFVAVFDAPLLASALGTVPFDPYLEVDRDDGLHDIHLPGRLPFADRPAGLPVESGVSSFIDSHGYPWALLVPHDFQFPLEGKRIDDTLAGAAPYPQFAAWRSSKGASNYTWYLQPTVSVNNPRVSAGAPGAMLARGWTMSTSGAAP